MAAISRCPTMRVSLRPSLSKFWSMDYCIRGYSRVFIPQKSVFSQGKPGSLTVRNMGTQIQETEEKELETRSPKLREVVGGVLPEWLITRAEELGFSTPTLTQRTGIPLGLSGKDFILHAQTGSGKTLVFLLPMLAFLDARRSAVQAIVVVPTRELGMQIARVARQLSGKGDVEANVAASSGKGRISVMALLDGGNSHRQKAWLKSEPPQVVVGTPDKILKMVETGNLRLSTVGFFVVDEIDAVSESTKLSDTRSLQKLISLLPPAVSRQTIFASATVPQHRHFLQECVKNKWMKEDAVHCHVEPEEAIPPFITHRFVVCEPKEKLESLHKAIRADGPKAAIVFVSEQSEKSKRSGLLTPAELVANFLTSKAREFQEMNDGEDECEDMEPLVLVGEAHTNERTSIIQDFRNGKRKILVATELAARGLDLPEVTHVYNFDLPPHVTSYVHRAGRTGRRPIDEVKGFVTTFVPRKEVFALRRLENQIRVAVEEIELDD